MRSKKAINGGVLGLLLSSGLLSACGIKTNDSITTYITWDGLEPDKWSSVWLIKRHIDPDAEVVLRPVGAPIENGIAFGVPEADFRRSHGISVYESLRQGFQLNDAALVEISRIIYDIEISPWSGKKSKYSATVERAYRALQTHFQKRVVPADCYGRFFDVVYELVQTRASDIEWEQLYALAEDDKACQTDSSTLVTRDDSPFVRQLETHVVLDHIGADKKVVFVDTREAAEFDEFRIPGAINLQLRDVDPDLKDQFEDADLVIAYCIKDFRGFEMARSLAEIGVKNVGIMKPYGIAGWRHMGLPVASRDGLSESEALDKLVQCARDVAHCVTNPS